MKMKPMTKKERAEHIRRMKSSQMKSINARKRSRSAFNKGTDLTKTIVADTLTHGGYSKAKATFHFVDGIRQHTESRRERRAARKEGKILRKDSKRRRK